MHRLYPMTACLSRFRRFGVRMAVLALMGGSVVHAQTPTGAPHRLPTMGPAAYKTYGKQSIPASTASMIQTVGGTMRGSESPQLRKLPVPPAHARDIATKLSMRYRELPGVTISPDSRNGQLVVMAPAKAHPVIASQVKTLVEGAVRQASSTIAGPLSVRLENISWREFERDLKQAAGQDVPMTSRNNGNQVTFQLNVHPLQGTVVDVDRRQNLVTVRAPGSSIPGWEKMIDALDRVPNRYDDVTKVHRLSNAEIAPVQRTMRLLRALKSNPTAAQGGSVIRNAVLQADQAGPGGQPAPGGEATLGEVVGGEGSGPLGDVQIEYVPELGQIIVKGATRDVQRVMDLIKEIEDKAALTQPDTEVVRLQHADANAVAELLTQLYDDVLSTRQGDVSITSLDSPNALLLIGRAEAIVSLKDLIEKIDQPVDEASKLRVFRLQNASAIDAQDAILTFFSNRPGVEDDLRNGLGPRVRISADFRTNSLIVSSSPRDMTEVTRLINELDVENTSAKSLLRVFPLNNASAEELATTLQDAFSAGEGIGDDQGTAPSTSLSIVAIDSDERRLVESGILAGATITADIGANAIVVRAPSSSMPLIAELIRQLDKTPGIDSLVKVFTIENGDAAQLSASLEILFGADASTTGTQIGGANAAGLPSSTAASESSLVPLRFSTDIRTNSIVASGSQEDLEVVESILLRLDSEGFAERITEVIWLRNNDAILVADAITNYVNDRQQSQTTIQQYQQGLGPFDLLDRDIVAIAEAQSNSILLSVSPRLYEEVRLLIDRLDRRRPMVMIKVVLAEVALEDQFEIGTELGLQDSLAFSRGQAVADLPGTIAAGTPGFNFNDAGVPNINDSSRNTLAGSTVSTFGLGQINPSIGYGGFVLNAASDSVSLLFRTLQDAGRAQIISRPQLMTADNTESIINVGRQIARYRGSTVNQNFVTQDIEDITIGLLLSLRPRVGSDGTILMEVDITRSDRDEGNGTVVPVGDGSGDTVLIEDIVDTTAQATLSVFSGQTVIMGGLIQKRRVAFSRRLPWVSNIPIIGNLFKYDFEGEERRELLVVLTPMLVTGEQDLEYIKQTESRRMSWCLADVVEAHGDVGLNGGYGLWGPAIGPVIYPDMQPTYDNSVVTGQAGGIPGAGGEACLDGEQPVVGAPVPGVFPNPAPVTMPQTTILDEGFNEPVPAPAMNQPIQNQPGGLYQPGAPNLPLPNQMQPSQPLPNTGQPYQDPRFQAPAGNTLPGAAPGNGQPTFQQSSYRQSSSIRQQGMTMPAGMIGNTREQALPAGWSDQSVKR